MIRNPRGGALSLAYLWYYSFHLVYDTSLWKAKPVSHLSREYVFACALTFYQKPRLHPVAKTCCLFCSLYWEIFLRKVGVVNFIRVLVDFCKKLNWNERKNEVEVTFLILNLFNLCFIFLVLRWQQGYHRLLVMKRRKLSLSIL